MSKSKEHDILEYNENGYIIILSDHALVTMVLAALEAYAVRKLGKIVHQKQLEVYGSLYGQEIPLKDGRTLYRVELASHDTTSRQTHDAVHFNDDASVLKRDTLASFWPHLDYLGDFHSHPYESLEETKSCRGYFCSDGDREELEDNWDFWKELRYRLGLVVTVAPLQRARQKEDLWEKGTKKQCLVMTLGNFRIWISAYCAYEEEDEDGDIVPSYTQDSDTLVELYAPSVTGLEEYLQYGRYRDGEFQR